MTRLFANSLFWLALLGVVVAAGGVLDYYNGHTFGEFATSALAFCGLCAFGWFISKLLVSAPENVEPPPED